MVICRLYTLQRLPNRFFMLLTSKHFRPTRFLQHWISILLLIMTADIYAASSTDHIKRDPGPILVTIKPIYSLVAHLTEGVTTPVLLMKQTQSPHHYNMRPSERRLLADARIIIWLGPQMESYLSKIIQQQDNAVVITAMEADQLKLLSKRQKHTHDADESVSDTPHGQHTIDPHIWLSTQNAAAVSRHIAASLIINDPVNAAAYKYNLKLLLEKIEQTSDFIKMTLKDNDRGFIAFHDAFQYFEEEYALNYIDSVNYDDETGVSLKQLRHIMAQIDEYNIQCLVYQDPKPAIVDSLNQRKPLRATALDPLGLNVENDKNAWFEIMRQLAVDFDRCLGS